MNPPQRSASFFESASCDDEATVPRDTLHRGDIVVQGSHALVVLREEKRVGSSSRVFVAREVTRWGRPVRGKAILKWLHSWRAYGGWNVITSPSPWLRSLANEAMAMESARRERPSESDGAEYAAFKGRESEATSRVKSFVSHWDRRGKTKYIVNFTSLPEVSYQHSRVSVSCASREDAEDAGRDALRSGLAQVVYLTDEVRSEVMRAMRGKPWRVDQKRTAELFDQRHRY